MRTKILIVEDDRTWAKLLTNVFTEKGYDVEVTDNVMKAMFRVANNSYDIVILDFLLPNFHGNCMEPLLLKLNIPALYLTGCDANEIKTVLPILEKSRNLKDIIDRIDAMINQNLSVRMNIPKSMTFPVQHVPLEHAVSV